MDEREEGCQGVIPVTADPRIRPGGERGGRVLGKPSRTLKKLEVWEKGLGKEIGANRKINLIANGLHLSGQRGGGNKRCRGGARQKHLDNSTYCK